MYLGKLKLLLIISTSLLLGCSNTPIISNSDGFDCGPEPVLEDLVLLDISPYIIKIEDTAHSCTSINDYEKMSINMTNIISAFKQKNAVIDYYKRCVNSQSKDIPKDSQ